MPAVKPAKDNDTAPINACVFNDNAQVTFAEGDEDKGKKFRIVGYT